MFDFGDITPDDVFTAGDEEVDPIRLRIWEAQIAVINLIEDDEIRLRVAKRWVAELRENV